MTYSPSVRRIVSGICIVSGAACGAPRAAYPTWAGPEGRTDDEISIVVENLLWNDVTIYSQVPGSKHRLGTVTTGQTRTFSVPRHQLLAIDLELVADPIGSSRTMTSGPILATPGQQIQWTVHRNAGVRMLIVR